MITVEGPGYTFKYAEGDGGKEPHDVMERGWGGWGGNLSEDGLG